MGFTGEILTKTSINQRMTPILDIQKAGIKEWFSQIRNLLIAENVIKLQAMKSLK